MTTLVCFRGSDGGEYAVPVESVREVRPHRTLLPLLSPRHGVAGLLAHEQGAVPVLTVFGDEGAHLLVLDREGESFGVIVEEVTKVVHVDGRVEQAPRGQEHPCITGIFRKDGDVVLVVDVDALDERLGA